MAIAFVKNETATAAQKAGGVSTMTITCATTHAAGNLVVVWALLSWATTGTVSSCADSKGNTYFRPGGTTDCRIFVSVLASSLGVGDTITITGTGDTWSKSAMSVAEFSGAAALTGNSSGQTAGFSISTTPSVSITPATAAVLIVGACGIIDGPTGDTFTQDSDTVGGDSWHSGPSAGTTGGSANTNCALRTVYKITTSAAAQTWNPTLGTARSGNIVLGTVPEIATITKKHLYTKNQVPIMRPALR